MSFFFVGIFCGMDEFGNFCKGLIECCFFLFFSIVNLFLKLLLEDFFNIFVINL